MAVAPQTVTVVVQSGLPTSLDAATLERTVNALRPAASYVSSCGVALIVLGAVGASVTWSFTSCICALALGVVLVSNFGGPNALQRMLTSRALPGVPSSASRDCCCAPVHVAPLSTAVVVLAAFEASIMLIVCIVAGRALGGPGSDGGSRFVLSRLVLGVLLPVVAAVLAGMASRKLAVDMQPIINQAFLSASTSAMPVAIPVAPYAPVGQPLSHTMTHPAYMQPGQGHAHAYAQQAAIGMPVQAYPGHPMPGAAMYGQPVLGQPVPVMYTQQYAYGYPAAQPQAAQSAQPGMHPPKSI